MIPQKGDVVKSIAVMKSFIGIGKEPPMHKYLPEQRLAYVGMAFIILMLVLSGLVKTYKNIYAPDMSYTVLLWATWIHNSFFVLFFLAFLAHMAAIALRPNWPMVRGIFTGRVRLDYARHRHTLWLADIEKIVAVPAVTVPATASSATEAELMPEPQTLTEEESLSVVKEVPVETNDEAANQKITSDRSE
jgi:cytochrome b subunit of formate dehydrogenase